ncbi:class I SAM-dependent methyltransferase [Antrihabitans cavernicola]|uniref:Class I SAM-dependent methyltransferase n=1 Tax=Antrihabitans cavernicola TaxID=2495913 RepID=A0A5A7S9S7_9NOCA|nr:class I SAM-dependent methyltransferase [Spelaeibacter cavernicola]KAA0022234.1 class I SAM-dependent methyltransferase [Spelaeibacter cavernicola]
MSEQFDKEFWDDRYGSQPAIWSGKPNVNLVAEASDLAPGTALEVGSGEGADAIWLAQRGWRVTGTDISTVALQRAGDHAEQAGVTGIDWLQADLMQPWDPPHTYDLISAQYMHLPTVERTRLFRTLAAAVAPNGTLLIVGHHPSDMETLMKRPNVPDLFFTGDDIVALLDPTEWEVVTNTAAPRPAHVHDEEIVIHDAVLRARKISAKRLRAGAR